MAERRWTLELGLAQNRDADVQLALRRKHFTRDRSQAAAPLGKALLGLAYSQRPTKRDLLIALDGVEKSERDGLVKIVTPARAAAIIIELLAELVVAYNPAVPLAAALATGAYTTETTYRRIRADAIIAYDEPVDAPDIRLYHVFGRVLMDVIPWLRACELCGRYYFKVRRQRVCLPAHNKVFYSRLGQMRARKSATRRQRKSTRGRKRIAYHAAVEQLHTAWLNLPRD